MPPRRLAIVVAMEQEVRPLLRRWRRRQVDASPGSAVRPLAVFESERAVLVVGGLGAKAAARAANMVLDLSQAGLLVSAGSAGAMKPELKVGSVFRPATVIDAATGARFAVPAGSGTLVTGAAILGPAEKKELASRFPADAVDMEAFAVAAVAQERGVEFMAIKSISDEMDFAMPPMRQFVDDEGQFHTGRFLGYVAVRPRLWAAVNRLAAGSIRAADALSAALEALEADIQHER